MKLNLAFIAFFFISPTLLNNIKASNIADFEEINPIPKKFNGELSLDMLQGILEQKPQKIYYKKGSLYQRKFRNGDEVYIYKARRLHAPEQIPQNPFIEMIEMLDGDPARTIWSYKLINNENDSCFNFSISFNNLLQARRMKSERDLKTRKHFNASYKQREEQNYDRNRPDSGTIEDEEHLKRLRFYSIINGTLAPELREKNLKKASKFKNKKSSPQSPRKPRRNKKKLRKAISHYNDDTINKGLIREMKKKQKKKQRKKQQNQDNESNSDQDNQGKFLQGNEESSKEA